MLIETSLRASVPPQPARSMHPDTTSTRKGAATWFVMSILLIPLLVSVAVASKPNREHCSYNDTIALSRRALNSLGHFCSTHGVFNNARRCRAAVIFALRSLLGFNRVFPRWSNISIPYDEYLYRTLSAMAQSHS
jgi:hypothetical protein